MGIFRGILTFSHNFVSYLVIIIYVNVFLGRTGSIGSSNL
jgi:formate hydrogenlyase subunit 4